MGQLHLIMLLLEVAVLQREDFLEQPERSLDLVLRITSSSLLQFAGCPIVLSKYWLD
jgi:hypothetical protein